MPEESAWKTRESLLMRVKDQTDEQSWDDFVRYYRPFIYNLVRGMKIQHHDAEEEFLADIVVFPSFMVSAGERHVIYRGDGREDCAKIPPEPRLVESADR